MNTTRPADGQADRLLCAGLALAFAALHLIDAVQSRAGWLPALLGIVGWGLLALAGYLRPVSLFMPSRRGVERARALSLGSDRWVTRLMTTGALCLLVSASLGLEAHAQVPVASLATSSR